MSASQPPPSQPPSSQTPASEPPVCLAASNTTTTEIPHELVFICCEEAGLDPYRDFDEVLQAVEDPPARECCESGCDPCVLTIVRAAALVRYRLPK